MPNIQTTDDLTIPPAHGRAGKGVASILPHLNRQEQIRDKPIEKGGGFAQQADASEGPSDSDSSCGDGGGD